MRFAQANFVMKRWKVAAYLAAGFVIFAMFLRLAVLPYDLTAVITIHDAQNSQLQAFSTNFFSLSKAGAAVTRKTSSPADRATDELERNETYVSFLSSLKERALSKNPGFDKDAQAEFEEYLGTTLANLDPNSRKTIQAVRELVSFTPISQSEVNVTISTKLPELTYFMGNEFLTHAVKSLKARETNEIEKVRSALEKQRDYYKAEFNKVTNDVEKFQRRPENAISLASGANLGTYLSDLMVRKNELELRIAENQRTIEFLGGSRAAHLAIARDLGQRSEIRQLMDETTLLKKQAGALQASINKFTSQSTGTVEAVRMYDELKKSADANFKNFQEANDTLSKLVVYQISIDSKFELFQRPEFEDVKPAMATTTLLALALLLSQMFFSGWVYVDWMRLRKPEIMHEPGFDGHLEPANWVVDIKQQLPQIVPRAEIQN